MKTVALEVLKNHLLAGFPVIDVRAPAEFITGSIPGSVNIPILDDQERHQVGLCYKTSGQEAAVDLGHKLVSAENLSKKCEQWIAILKQHPQAIITCFRGGLRSQKTQEFLMNLGFSTVRLDKGYKSARAYFLETLTDFSNTGVDSADILLLTGNTGSGKTHLLNAINLFYPTLDLEGLAKHRGSAFGAWESPQPSQVDFENNLAVQILKLMQNEQKRPVILEDESRMIGHRHIPENLFSKMREAKVILLLEPLENRIENIFSDYISDKLNLNSSDAQIQAILGNYKASVQKIKTKLGGLRAQELTHDLESCEKNFIENKDLSGNKTWIEKLLVWYYDPMYLGSLQKRNPQILFKGNTQQVKDYFRL